METQPNHVEVGSPSRKLLRKTSPLAIALVIASTLAGCKSSTDKNSKKSQYSSSIIKKETPTNTTCPDNGVYTDGHCLCAGAALNGQSSNCTYINIDPDNCGTYGNKCAETEGCTDGECGCRWGMIACGDNFCADTKRDPENCGACDNKCPLGEECSEGSCVACKSTKEICDKLDNNCNREIDEGLTCECTHRSQKPCGSNVGTCSQGIQTCTEEGKWSSCEGEVGPEPETCDSLDNDCNGKWDDGIPCECTHRSSKPCGSNVGTCSQGIQTCTEEGKWGSCEGEGKPKPEICDNEKDDDCDGKTDSKDEKDCPKK